MKEEIKNAVIESARLGFEERGILDAWLQLDYGGMCQGFGGFALYLPKSFDHHQIKSPAGHFLYRVMEVAGVEKWDSLKGRTIRVKSEEGWNGRIIAIGHIVKDDWFNPTEDFSKLKEQPKP